MKKVILLMSLLVISLDVSAFECTAFRSEVTPEGYSDKSEKLKPKKTHLTGQVRVEVDVLDGYFSVNYEEKSDELRTIISVNPPDYDIGTLSRGKLDNLGQYKHTYVHKNKTYMLNCSK